MMLLVLIGDFVRWWGGGYKINFQWQCAAALYNTSSYLLWMENSWETFSYKTALCRFGTQSYGKSITTLSRETTWGFLRRSSRQSGKYWPWNYCLISLIKVFSKSSPISELRVTEKANQRDRPVRKPAVWTGQEPADEIHPYFSLMMTWLIFPQSAQM